MKHFTIIPATIAVLFGSAATAQDTTYLSYGVAYENYSVDGDSINIASAGASFETTIDKFMFAGNFGTIQLSEESDNVSFSNIGLRAGYYVTPNVILFSDIDYLTADDDSVTAFTLGGEVKFGAVTTGLTYTDLNEDGAEEAISVYGSYAFNSALEVGLYVTDQGEETTTSLGFDFKNDRIDVVALLTEIDDTAVFGFDSRYDFGNSFRAGLGYADYEDEFYEVSMSAGYEVRDDLWVDLNLGRLEGGSDVIGLELTFETGRQALLADRASEVQARSLGTLGSLFAANGLR